jgi:two-component sensor histidine kinase
VPNRNLRVLHIDDDAALARLIQRVLSRTGCQVENAATGEAGLARIRQGGIDVVVLDHYLAGETGLSILKSLADVPDAPPVVYVTGSTEPAVAVEALKAGAADYVLKTAGEDFTLQLESAITQAIEKARLKREKEKAELEVRAARDRAELLLAEVNHRVSNSLALVAALVRMQTSAVADQTAKDALAETQARLSAIADLHRRLYTSDDIRHVDLDAYLAALVGALEASMKAAGHLPEIRHVLDPFRIATDKAVSVGMLVTELVTNACKYAYPGEAGEVRVTLRAQGGGRAILTVEDDGVGIAAKDAPKGTGLGTRIVQAMATNLGTSINYGGQERGTRAWIEIGAEG